MIAGPASFARLPAGESGARCETAAVKQGFRYWKNHRGTDVCPATWRLWTIGPGVMRVSLS